LTVRLVSALSMIILGPVVKLAKWLSPSSVIFVIVPAAVVLAPLASIPCYQDRALETRALSNGAIKR
jgi:hypothetical protein